MRSLLGLQSEQDNETNQNLANGAETTRRVPDNRRRWEGVGNKPGTGNLAEEMLINTEESVMANFDFLAREDDLEDEDEVIISAYAWLHITLTVPRLWQRNLMMGLIPRRL